MKIRFNFLNGKKLVIEFSSSDICDVVEDPVFVKYVKVCDFWERLNENGLSYLEQLKADGKIRYTLSDLKEKGEI